MRWRAFKGEDLHLFPVLARAIQPPRRAPQTKRGILSVKCVTETQLPPIDENLIRAELTASQRAYAIKRRKELWEMRHGKEEPIEESGTSCPTLPEPTTGRGNKQFAADTADRTGQSKRSINEHVSRAVQ